MREEIKPDFNKDEAENIYGNKNSNEPAVHMEYSDEKSAADYVMKYF